MSGIIGLYFLDHRPIDSRRLQQMTDTLAHRGPDDAGTWRDGPVGLGHRMLWTTPESLHEHLPLISDGGQRVLTADARIDNRDELISALGIRSDTIPDSHLILEAYERWGEHCVDHLLGDFAFALWDATKQRLFCARDHMGVRPFYYYRSDALFAFASEIKALLFLPDVPQKLNEAWIARYLIADLSSLDALFDDRQTTAFQDVFRLPAAHSMSVNQQNAHLNRYWSVDPAYEIRLNSDAEYEQAFREIFTEAVRCRLRSAFPIGIELSGGLDSSAVTSVARALLRHEAADTGASLLPIQTFSAVFENDSYDERVFINALLAEGDLEPHYVYPDQKSPLGDIESLLWHEDEPFYDLFSFYKSALNAAAHESGSRIVLDGESGDAVISYGYRVVADLVFRGKWCDALHYLTENSRKYKTPLLSLVKSEVIVAGAERLAPISVRRAWRKLRGSQQNSFADNAFVDPNLIRRSGVTELLQAHQESADQQRTSREYHAAWLSGGNCQYDLETLDKAAAACSLELRHPFYDRRVIEFCVALPPGQKLRDGYTRAILRRGLASLLPAKIRNRVGKANFLPVLYQGLLRFERRRLEDTFVNKPQILEPYVDLDQIKLAYAKFLLNPEDMVFAIWKALILALWLQSRDAR